MDEINKKELSQSDICDLFITPAIKDAGWDQMRQIRREVTLAPGPVVVRGNVSSRNKKKKKFADYVLYWEPGVPVARETADLFLAVIIKLLKKNGRAAVVLPDGFFFGEGMKTRLKEKLLQECNLHTIVRLPNGVFNPYTGIKTNLLFFTKGRPTEQIWYYEHPYPKGVKSYNKTKPMQFEEFQPEIDWWGDEADGFSTRGETEQAWKVSADDIKARNYNLDFKNPHVGEPVAHDPEKLLKKYANQQKEISSLRDQLKTILAEALTR